MLKMLFWILLAFVGMYLYVFPHVVYEGFVISARRGARGIQQAIPDAPSGSQPGETTVGGGSAATTATTTTATTAPTTTTTAPTTATTAATNTTEDAAPAAAEPATTTTAAAAPASPTNDDMVRLLRSIEAMMGGATYMPDFTNSPTAPEDSILSNSGRQQPQEASTTRSQPESTRSAGVSTSASLEQSRDFQRPSVPVHIIERIVQVPAQCPPPPKCPDMSNYIRKDKIPCWACSL